MNTISVCLIIKNEEAVLERCLKSVKGFADEIVVVDTGSTDDSKNIAKKYTGQVFDFIWQDDFSAARNFSFSKATCDYIMWLDADDIVLDEDAIKIWDFKLSKHSNIDILMCKYVTGYDKDFKPTFSFYRERILKRKSGFVWQDPVHEVIVPRGKIEWTDIQVFHAKINHARSNRNLVIYQKYIAGGATLSARQQFYYSRELMYNNLFDEAILNFEKFLKREESWLENKIEACLNLANCYQNIGDDTNAKRALLSSFVFDKPRSEILCELGNLFLKENALSQAIYFYKLALKNKPNMQSGGFVMEECYDFLPNLQLSVCYYRKNKKRLAKRYHEKAKKKNPQHPSVIFNEKFFK